MLRGASLLLVFGATASAFAPTSVLLRGTKHLSSVDVISRAGASLVGPSVTAKMLRPPAAAATARRLAKKTCMMTASEKQSPLEGGEKNLPPLHPIAALLHRKSFCFPPKIENRTCTASPPPPQLQGKVPRLSARIQLQPSSHLTILIRQSAPMRPNSCLLTGWIASTCRRPEGNRGGGAPYKHVARKVRARRRSDGVPPPQV